MTQDTPGSENAIRTRNGRILLKSICSECGAKKSRFVSEQEGSGFLSKLVSKIPLINKII